ncbi:unnamed protein product, partial [Closterium sp. NIES-64]
MMGCGNVGGGENLVARDEREGRKRRQEELCPHRSSTHGLLQCGALNESDCEMETPL